MQAVTITQITYPELERLIEDSLTKILGTFTEKKKNEDDLLSLDEACEFLNLQRATIYGMTSNRQIPFIKKSKKLYFSKADLTAWLKTSSRKVKIEIA
jgi:excisionase family DNA binding protein